MHDIFVVKSNNSSKKILEQFPHAKTVDYNNNRLVLFEQVAKQTVTEHAWILNSNCDYTDFNFDYRPLWHQNDQMHVWPTHNQCQGGDTVLINAKEFLKQIHSLDAAQNYQDVCWKEQSLAQQIKPEIFVWSRANVVDVPETTVLRYIGNHLDMMRKTARKATTPYVWVISDELDYSDFDFDWRPSWATENFLHVWPTENQQQGGDTFYINVEQFVAQQDIESLNHYQTIQWHKQHIPQIVKPEIFVWDRHNNDTLKNLYPSATFLRHVGSRYSMMEKTVRRAATPCFWVIDSNCDYTDFDFDWRPSWATDKHLHVWPTKNQVKGGDTYYVNAAEFKTQCLEIDSIDQYCVINWHTKNVKLSNIPDIVIWNFGGNEENLASIKKRFPAAKSLRYIGTHLEMVKKSVKYADSDSFWILSDCCDYTDFDPSWKPDWETENSIHCWASGDQKFGDTFFVPKLNFVQEADTLNKLEYYSSVIWHSNGYDRLPWPVNYIKNSDIYSTVKNHKFTTVYEYFVAPGSTIGSTVDPSLWEKRLLIAYNRNGHVSLCPRDCISDISNRLLDYPHIQYHNCEKSTEKPQDIVFISYDEKDADLNYELLKKRFPHATRIHGIEGLVNAKKIAADRCKTPWFYAVFAKTKIADSFNFDFNPNYLETPGNYIFQAYNPVTDNTYGHGAVVMYHCKTVSEATTWGYDFTTSFPFTHIPLLSCYNSVQNEWEAWRTSFREVLKLREMNTVESRFRLHCWLTVSNSELGKWSMLGAQDAMQYNGSLDQANDWKWLNDYFIKKHQQLQ
jgi:hypothetical protein